MVYSTVNSIRSKIVEDVIFDIFVKKKFENNHPKSGGGSKMKILALLTKLNQIPYTYSVDPQKARNAKTKSSLI